MGADTLRPNDEVKEFVVEYFEQRGVDGIDSEEELLRFRYLERRIIDSLGIIELITSLENRFDIRFSPEEMQSAEFGTMGGLIGIIKRSMMDR